MIPTIIFTDAEQWYEYAEKRNEKISNLAVKDLAKSTSYYLPIT